MASPMPVGEPSARACSSGGHRTPVHAWARRSALEARYAVVDLYYCHNQWLGLAKQTQFMGNRLAVAVGPTPAWGCHGMKKTRDSGSAYSAAFVQGRRRPWAGSSVPPKRPPADRSSTSIERATAPATKPCTSPPETAHRRGSVPLSLRELLFDQLNEHSLLDRLGDEKPPADHARRTP